jgi:hypothetical protein
MTKSLFRIGAIFALTFMATQMTLSAEEDHRLTGTWDVTVTVTDCHGAPVRTVRSIQMFDHNGSMTETANTSSRGISLGAWKRGHPGDQIFDASYWFFRYTTTGTFASFAKVLDTITLSPDGTEFTSAGTVQDYDANGNSLSIGCFTHSAKRLASPGHWN